MHLLLWLIPAAVLIGGFWGISMIPAGMLSLFGTIVLCVLVACIAALLGLLIVVANQPWQFNDGED